MSYFDDIKFLHEQHDIHYEGKPRLLIGDELYLRMKLLREEHEEYRNACLLNDPHEILDALVDICVVAIGTAAQHGYDFDTAWHRVLKANLAKRPAKTEEEIEKTKRKIKNDLYKPEGWTAPDLTDLV